MATRGRATFQKRQKEMARKDKQQRKAERRAQRKLDGSDAGNTLLDDIEPVAAEDIEPLAALEPESEPRES